MMTRIKCPECGKYLKIEISALDEEKEYLDHLSFWQKIDDGILDALRNTNRTLSIRELSKLTNTSRKITGQAISRLVESGKVGVIKSKTHDRYIPSPPQELW